MILVRLSVLLLFFCRYCSVSAMSRVHLTPDGGYKGIVVKIDTDVGQDGCQEIINNVKVKHLLYYIQNLSFSFGYSFFI